MEDLRIESDQISWKRTKVKWNTEYLYKTEVMMHDDHISVSTRMYVGDELKDINLSHIPIALMECINTMIDQAETTNTKT